MGRGIIGGWLKNRLVGPTQNYALVLPSGKIVLSALMILGRLEILTVLALLIPPIWRR